MQINRKNIFKRYKWLKEKKLHFIISADYDGIICASFLNHYLKWQLSGYYDYNSIWLSKEAILNKKKLIWVDLNILPSTGKSLGGQIISLGDKVPKGFNTSCNANILYKINENNFEKKFPFSTLLFLMWLHEIEYTKDDIGKLLLLQSDNTWMKIQKYSENVNSWKKNLTEYKWDLLFKGVENINYELKIDQFLYPKLINIGAATGFSKLTSKHLRIKSRECKFNPDWDGDIILKLFNLFAQNLNWTPPKLPQIINRIEGERYKLPLTHVKKIGLGKFIKQNHIFSYAITDPHNFNYTVFRKFKNDK